jgi:hypothetical protein
LFSCGINKTFHKSDNVNYRSHIFFGNEEFIGFVKFDSLKSIKLKLYDKSGFKLVDIALKDSVLEVNYIINNELKQKIEYYYNLTNKEINVCSLINILFKGLDKIKLYNFNYEILEKNETLQIDFISYSGNIRILVETKNFYKIDSIIHMKDFDVKINETINFKVLDYNE